MFFHEGKHDVVGSRPSWSILFCVGEGGDKITKMRWSRALAGVSAGPYRRDRVLEVWRKKS